MDTAGRATTELQGQRQGPWTLEQITGALRAIHDPFTSNANRQQAQAFCESLKQDPASAIYGHFLAHKSNGQPPEIRHFGLGLIENSVRYKWTDGSVDASRKAEIRNNVILLLVEGLQPILEEPMYIKEKAARVFVEVAKRCWPGEWDDMDMVLQQLFNTNESSREMSLLILRCLCEDVFVFADSVAELRKNDLRTGLLVIMSSEAVLQEQYPEGVSGSSGSNKNEVRLMTGQRGNEGWINRLCKLFQGFQARKQQLSPIDQRIFGAALAVVTSALDWVIVKTVQESELARTVLNAMSVPHDPIRLAAATAFDVLASRNYSEGDRDIVILPILSNDGVAMISQSYYTLSTQAVTGEAYQFLQRLVQATINLGELQLCNRRSTSSPQGLSDFLALVLDMSTHPSILISLLASCFWPTLLRHGHFSKDPVVKSITPSLLQLYGQFLSWKILGRLRKTNPAVDHFANLDFDSSEVEFTAAGRTRTAKAIDTIHLGVAILPLECLTWVAGKVAEALKFEIQTKDQDKDSAIVLEFDATLTLMDITVPSLSPALKAGSSTTPFGISEGTEGETTRQILEGIYGMLDMLLKYQSQSLIAMDRVVGSFAVFTDFLKFSPGLLYPCLKKLFTLVSLDQATISGVSASASPTLVLEPSPELRDLRRRAATTLLKMARSIPDALFVIYADIESALGDMFAKELVSPADKRTLLCFLLLIGFNNDGSSQPQGQTRDSASIFNSVALPVIQLLGSSENSTALSTPESFMGFIGIPQLEGLSSVGSVDVKTLADAGSVLFTHRLGLSWPIATIFALLSESLKSRHGRESKDSKQRKLDIWAPTLIQIVPPLLNTIQQLNAINDTRLWKDYPSEVQQVLVMTVEEKRSLVFSVAPTENTSSNPENEFNSLSSLVRSVRLWLSSVREDSNRLFAQVSSFPQFYTVPNLPAMLESTLFKNVDLLNNRQLRFLLQQTVQPLVINCPASSMDSILGQFIGNLLQYLNHRLARDWTAAMMEGLQMDEQDEEANTGDQQDQDEVISDTIVSEAMLREFSRSCTLLISTLVQTDPLSSQCVAFETGMIRTTATPVTNANQPPHTPLQLFTFCTPTIFEPMVNLICQTMVIHDTRSSIKAADIARSLFSTLLSLSQPTLLQSPMSEHHFQVLSTLPSRLLSAAFETLQDPYHHEGQDKLVQLITEMYVDSLDLVTESRAASSSFTSQQLVASATAAATANRQVFLSRLQPTVSVPQMDQFDQSLQAIPKTSSQKSKRQALTKIFLQGIMGVAKSEWFKQQKNGSSGVGASGDTSSARTITGIYVKPSKSVLDAADADDIGDGLANMFDDGM